MKSLSATIRQRIGLHRHVSGPATWWLPLKKGPGITFTVLFVAVLVTATFFSSSWINSFSLFPTNPTQTCPSNYPTKMVETEINDDPSSNSTCPDYFRLIHEDLRPFKATGITRDMVERAKRTAHFRVAIVKGKVYVEKYKKSIQTRDVFTLWGILQLLRRYPGRLPDLELMFDCDDRPVIQSSDHSGPNAAAPPPLFRYCGDQKTLDIVFPDWSFWGW
ncbi:hypothetical protein Vadar_025074 [Vaccinium darrowii]|uniref:Uncharacterized protein n=1 Tax=Vaccinium darrowii TaxID=229202 RepID=A0ACB7XJV4_9ERIC|nr:hypothetical protein Vadar_025074 [Vaccinium darrowii]